MRKTSRTPFIIYTGRGSEEVASEAFATGVDDYVRKEQTLAHYKILARSIRHAVEKDRAEEEVELSNQRMRGILESIEETFWQVDSGWDFVYVSKRFADAAGMKPEEMVGQSIWRLFPNHLGTAFERNLREAMELREIRRFEISGKYTDAWYSMTFYPSVEGVSALGTDITEHKKLEATLMEERDRLSALVNSIQDEIWFADTDKKFTLVNPSALKEFGFTSADSNIDVEKLALSLEVYRPDGSPRPVEEAPPLRALNGEIIHRQEEIIKTPVTGELRYRSVSAAPVRDAYGIIIGSVSVVRDITESKKAADNLRAVNEELETTQKELKTANEKFRDSISELEVYYDSAPIGLAVLSRDLKYIRVNKWLAELNRIPPDQHIGHPFRELVPFLADQADAIKRQILETGQPIIDVEFNSEAAGTLPDDVRTFLMSWYPLKDELGWVSGFNVVVNEITKMKRVEAELQASNEELESSNEELAAAEEELRVSREQIQEYANKLEGLVESGAERLHESVNYTRSLIEASIDPLVTISRDGRITDVNEATVQATGVPREEIIGSDFSDYFTDPEKARVGYRRVFEEGQVRNYPLTIRHRTGKITEVLYNATIYRNPSGEVAGIFAAARDVSEQRELEEKLQRTEVIAAVEQIGATVAHDLRGPLGLIVQSIQMAKKDPSLTPRMLQLAEDNAVRSLKMIADWRSSTRQIVPRPVKTDLGALVKSALEGSMIPMNVEVVTSLGEGPEYVELDPDIMRRVVDNLVKNAIEAMPGGGRLTVSVDKVENVLVMNIEDTGMGIPEEAKDKIWSPLYSTKSGGMGLGLTYSKRSVEAMGGTIDFERARRL